MDSALTLLLLLAVLAALAAVAALALSRSRPDPCLRLLEGFLVHVEERAGRRRRGRLHAHATGVELEHPEPRPGREGALETSVLLYEDELAEVLAVRQEHEERSPRQEAARRRLLERLLHPGAGRRAARLLRRAADLLHDVLRPDRSHAWEPMLESWLGRRVIAEETRGQAREPVAGVLAEYSRDWLLLVDCRRRRRLEVHLAEPESLEAQRHLDFLVRPVRDAEGGVRSVELEIANRGQRAVQVLRVEAPGFHQEIGAELSPQRRLGIRCVDLPAEILEHPGLAALDDEGGPAPALPGLRLVLEVESEEDLCLPRSRARVRHGGEIRPAGRLPWRRRRS